MPTEGISRGAPGAGGECADPGAQGSNNADLPRRVALPLEEQVEEGHYEGERAEVHGIPNL